MYATNRRKRKIIVYSHDTYGLGNIRRMLVIAQALVENDPNVSVLILSGSPMLHAFRIPPRIDYIKLPCLTRSTEGEYSAKFLDIDYEQILRLRSNIILSSILDFDPDLILVDKKPFGVSDELSDTLKTLKRQHHRSKVVLLLRDILDSPESTMKIWKKNGYHDAIISYYDQLLVVGSPDIFDMRKEYCFPEASHRKTRFCGYIAREAGRQSRSKIRETYGIKNERMILLTPGGGEDGYQLLSCYLEGLIAQPIQTSTKTLVICGPEMAQIHSQHIKTLAAKCQNVVIESFTDDMMSCMNAADLVISMGGYNTICELLTLGKRAIVIPRVKPVQEQWLRAERLEQLGLLRAIHPDKLDSSMLMNVVNEVLSHPFEHEKHRYQINLKGLTGVCESVYSLLDETRHRSIPERKNVSIPLLKPFLVNATL
ncbi:MAG: glycosyltransferase [Methylococcaceae bacterium]|nr:glycosyltransferase [Methylococcaceae bacterium]